jgi:hypothetical protein
MSLGGYKFAGKYCEKGSLTDVQWALLMHKTKVAAFMAANALSGAGWDYDMTGSPDGNYHCLDAVGNNYVTVFKRTNGTDDYTWFAIYTICKYTWSGTDTGAIKLYLYANYPYSYMGYFATSFYRIGTSAITYSDDLSTAPTSHANIIGPLPLGNPGANYQDIGSSYYPPADTSFKDVSTAMFGFAIRADSIIMFQGTAFFAGYISCSVASGHGFSSFASASDACGLFAYNTQAESNTSGPDVDANKENAARNVTITNMKSDICSAVDGSTGQPTYQAKLNALIMAYYSTSVQEYPFQAIAVSGVLNSATKITGKGTLSIDLISVNFPGINQGLVPSVYSTVANGNYLCVNVISGNNYFVCNPLNRTTASSVNAAMYVGWDPSNPDITQASAWQLYDGT